MEATKNKIEVNCLNDGKSSGYVIVEVEVYGPYDKVWSALVVERHAFRWAHPGDVPQVGEYLWHIGGPFAVGNEGDPTKIPTEDWANTPSKPACPKCGSPDHLRWNYEGTKVSCWTGEYEDSLDLLGRPYKKQIGTITCWRGNPTELIQHTRHNHWVEQIGAS